MWCGVEETNKVYYEVRERPVSVLSSPGADIGYATSGSGTWMSSYRFEVNFIFFLSENEKGD